MENTVTLSDLTVKEQEIVTSGKGWDGSQYSDLASGIVLELVADNAYRVLSKGDQVEETSAESAPETTDVPPAPTEPENVPVAPETTDPTVSESQDTTAPAPETEPVPEATPETTEPVVEKSFLGKILG